MRVCPRASNSPFYKTELQRARAEAGLTQAELGEQAGVSLNTVNLMENRTRTEKGRLRTFYPRTATAVARALGQPMEALFEVAGGEGQSQE